MPPVRRPLPPAPPDLWDRPEMVEALARRNMGAVLTIYRKWTGATQTQIAGACEVPQSHVSEIQHGRRQVTSLEIFERMADGLGIPRRPLGLADRPGEESHPASAAPSAEVPAEIVRIYPNRGAVPGELWRSLLRGAREQVDVLVFAGLFLPDGHADFVALLRQKVQNGAKIRYLLGDPASEAVALRGHEEGIADGLAARIRITLTYLSSLREVPGVEVRLHATALYNSIYRFDGHMLVNAHVYGAPAAHSPVIHLRETADGLFEYYAASFERVWATSEGAW
ncbi:helix-turn-helix domain-containing protein [Frankia sp. CNm7]|uniref:Helix-turn-helix domain-containing protein n=1 Tax=Frankia nepalensis TaxID=1836974 RepID=A0A937UN85_9ACTN|nr:helix-turn-helix domain-containing protein [Frankia nepalensis]MBL7500327.1 helix-turn-helix domain-containing protein [Frankia nepalensis]MBL7508549.1 helix-turn-helix domain-containing protein [Frankia nepalensis]MBL7521247.1 helix-turn-helix domain-containing protein [Frankia nepalensis]MBL7627677.1 helix-turn-helix domain-containing protein [Frankia nepalensis]